jgi:transcriptional regulator with XRE-family HTH domain
MNGILESLNTTEKIKAILAVKNITQIDIATLLGVTPETIRNRMIASRWDIEDLKKIAAKCEIEITDLI